jgi:hypothetical protein
MGYDLAVDLSNGLDEFTGNLVPTREERNLIDSFSDADASTIEYIVVNFLSSGSRGESFIPSIPQQADNLLFTNVMILAQGSVGLDPSGAPRAFVTAAHEAGHIMLDDGDHTNPGTLDGRVNLMVGGGTDAADSVINSKRLTETQCTTARSF